MLGLLIAAGLAAAAPTAPTPAPAAPKPATAQQLFDAATTAWQEHRFAEAVSTFESLESHPSIQRNPAVLGVIRIRKGQSLVGLGRDDEAEAALQAGLASVPADAANYRQDVALARIALGRSMMAHYDYMAAAAQFELAESSADAAQDKVTALSMLAYATMFEPDDRAIGYSDKALALTLATPGFDKEYRATIRTVRARALLNHGRLADAYAELKTALAEQGGLGFRVGLGDIVTRSDLAITALLNKDEDNARKYMAYTGAGRLEKAPFATAAFLDLPACGGDADLKPDDVVVVEFNIRDDGQVGFAAPIYTSRLGPAATIFARTVAHWSWKPADAKIIPVLFRAATRVELRCSTTAPRPWPGTALAPYLQKWLAANGASYAYEESTVPPPLAKLEQDFEGKWRNVGTPAAIPILLRLAAHPVASKEERKLWIANAAAIAAATGAPAPARAYIDIVGIHLDNDDFQLQRQRGRFRTLLARPDYAGDMITAATLRLMIAEPGWRSSAASDAEQLLRQVADDSRLPPNDPLRIGALVRLAAVLADKGDLAQARSAYGATGLGAEQCALMDARPGLLRANASSSDFPNEAMRWGFEGWVKVEFDIQASGRAASPRAVVAYPPFVFRKAAIGMTKDFVYSASYRPEGSPGCAGQQESIRFIMRSGQ